jgi:O-antigen ligase
MLGYLVIALVLLIIGNCFRRGYSMGLSASLFFLVLLPDNLAVNISISLPSFTIHRLILMLWFLFWVREPTIERRTRGIQFFRLLVALAVSLLASTLISQNFMVSVKRYLYFLIESLLFFVMIQTSLKDADHMTRILRVVSISLFLVALVGIVQRYTGFNPSPLLGQKQMYDFEVSVNVTTSDVTSTYLHRILFGIGMAIGGINSIFASQQERKPGRKRLMFVFALVTMLAMYFSLSRGPWLAFVVAIVFLTFLSPRKYMGLSIGIVVLGGALLILRPGILETFTGFYQSTMDPDSLKGASYNWRFQVWEMAFEKVRSVNLLHTLFGFGGGSHIFMEFGVVQLSNGRTTVFESWDSEFAVILYDMGVSGLLFFVAMYFTIFAKGIRYCRRGGPGREVMVLALSILVLIVFMKTNVRIYAPQLIYLEFFNIAVVSKLLSLAEEEKFNEEPGIGESLIQSG